MPAAPSPRPNRGLGIDSPRGRYPTRGGRTGHNAGWNRQRMVPCLELA